MQLENVEIKDVIDMTLNASTELFDKRLQKALEIGLLMGVETGARIGAEIGAKTGAREAVRAIKKETEKYSNELNSKKFKNTKLLLKNYRNLSNYCEMAISDIKELENADMSFADVMKPFYEEQDLLRIESIKKNKARSIIIMQHIDKMLEIYKNICLNSSKQQDQRRWRVLECLYLSDDRLTSKEVADIEYVDKRTVYKDLDVCFSDLSALFFGVASLEK